MERLHNACASRGFLSKMPAGAQPFGDIILYKPNRFKYNGVN